MLVRAIKTEIVTSQTGDLLKFLDENILKITDGSVLAITSKIVALCQQNVVNLDVDKDFLIQHESDWFLPRSSNKYNVCLTIKDNVLMASAGIDESNSEGKYVLLPKNVQTITNQIREYFSEKFKLTNFGVIITDSRTCPLQWGVTGFALSYSGFQPLKDYIGSPDLFNRPFHYSKASVLNGLAATAVLVMGEGAESQPIVLIEELPFVDFQNRNPTEQELKNLIIQPEDDLYAPLLTNANWQKVT